MADPLGPSGWAYWRARFKTSNRELMRKRAEIERLKGVLARAYDGMLNHHLHDQDENDTITNEIAKELPYKVCHRIAFGPMRF